MHGDISRRTFSERHAYRAVVLQQGRVVLDALSELRLLAETTIRYRRQLLAFKQFFLTRHCTVLLLDDCTVAAGDPHGTNLWAGTGFRGARGLPAAAIVSGLGFG